MADRIRAIDLLDLLKDRIAYLSGKCYLLNA